MTAKTKRKKDNLYLALFTLGVMFGVLVGSLIIFFEFYFDWNNSLENNGFMRISECDSVLKPCACCGDLCQGYNCDWDKRYQIDSDNCRLK